MRKYIRWFHEISIRDVPLVGGKSASLGEMFQALIPKGIQIPPGFAITADAFSAIIAQDDISDRIYGLLSKLKPDDVSDLARVGHEVRTLVRKAGIPQELAEEIRQAYAALCKNTNRSDLDVAVRSSATAEDLPDASFAGQQETFLNIRGEEDLLDACLNCFASLFTDRAISYRTHKGFDHRKVKLSVCVQQMVRSDLASSGVIFTLDTESGARNVILVTSAYGLGENVVGGKVDPDEFLVSKPLLGKAIVPILRRKVGSKQLKLIYSGHGTKRTRNVDVSKADRAQLSLSDQEVLNLAQWAKQIEEYYTQLNERDTPMDLEWAKDGRTGNLFILQARPETVHSVAIHSQDALFILSKRSHVLLRGRAVGTKIGAGPVRMIHDVTELNQFKEGEVLITEMTDPDWEPVMKRASAIVTNRGGRTCHAAIVSREHGVPCLVGTGTATVDLHDGQQVTVCCAEGDEGFVYEGVLPFQQEKLDWKTLRNPRTQVMVNLGNPSQAFKTALLPISGVGLARLEFIISEMVKIHPMALAHLDQIRNADVRQRILETLGTSQNDPAHYFVEKLSEGIGMIAGAFYPRPVIVRVSDFKTNEYAHLLGGQQFEPSEENPMIGFRGASRYYNSRYQDGFALECRALKFIREQMGLTNVKIMIPFCRSPEEGRRVLEEMAKHGLKRGENGLEVFVMSELPSNVLRADEFAQVFDGFSIGSNDLTQMVLGVDRDSEVICHLFDERDPAVLKMLRFAIESALKCGRHIGICGQAPSDYPEITQFLVEHGIQSISVTPDAVFKTIHTVVDAEKQIEAKPIELRRISI